MPASKAQKILLILPVLVLVLGLLFWRNSNRVDLSKTNDATVQLTDLAEFDVLRQTFERDSGYVRLITQLSPT